MMEVLAKTSRLESAKHETSCLAISGDHSSIQQKHKLEFTTAAYVQLSFTAQNDGE